jgi:hypothetical protein
MTGKFEAYDGEFGAELLQEKRASNSNQTELLPPYDRQIESTRESFLELSCCRRSAPFFNETGGTNNEDVRMARTSKRRSRWSNAQDWVQSQQPVASPAAY